MDNSHQPTTVTHLCKSCCCVKQQQHQQQHRHHHKSRHSFTMDKITPSLLLTLLLVVGPLPLIHGEEGVYVLPLTKREHNLHRMDSEENSRQRRSISAGNLGGTPGQGYFIEMGVGTPPQMFNVLVDTGSSNFAIAGSPHTDVGHYFNTSASSTFEYIGTEVYVPYTKGDWHGYLGQDEVTIAALPNITVTAEFASIDEATEFYIVGSDWQGILGMGYAEIARPDSSVVPFFNALVNENKVKEAVFSMQLCGQMEPDETSFAGGMGGTLVLGGVDKSLYKGDIMYSKLHKEWYYEVIVTDIKVKDKSVNMPCKEYNFDKTIVDSGTTNLRLPNKVFEAVTTLVNKHTELEYQQIPYAFWTGEDMLCWTKGLVPWSSFPSLTLSMAESENMTFDLVVSPRQYLRPVQDSYGVGTTTESGIGEEECYKYAIVPSESGSVIGAVIMEGYYVVFDQKNRQVGFAESTCTNRNPADFNSKLTNYRKADFNTTICAYYKMDTDRSGLLTVAYILSGLCGLCLFMLCVMVTQWQLQKCRRRFGGTPNPSTQLLEEDTDSFSR